MKAGISGHRDLVDTLTIDWLEKEMSNELDKLNIEKAYSSLAAGTDQLFATLVLSKKIPLIAVIPSHHYEKTFPRDKLETYHLLLNQAAEIIQLEYENPTETAFYEAGKLIVKGSDIIFAVWNNLPAKGLGGTADIVNYAKSQHKKLVHFDPFKRTINYMNN